MPLPRQEVASAVAGSPPALYVVGGFDPGRLSSRSVQVLSEGWTAGPDYPLPIDHAGAAAAGGRLYVVGGFSNGAARAEVYALIGDGWRAVAPLHHPRGALAVVSIDDHLYAIGGRAGQEVSEVERYDPVQNGWGDVAVLPQPRDHLAGFVDAGRACVAGGRFPTTARVDCFDPNSLGWTRLPDLPRPTSGSGAIALGGAILVAGGEDAAESTLIDQVFRFRAGTWSAEPMLVPRHGIQAAEFRQRAWVCGGATAAAYRPTADCTSIR